MPGERVLVIDDSQQIRDFVVNRILKPNGFEVDSARDGNEGLRKALAAPPPDLILLDYEMPGLNGTQVLEALRNQQIYIPTLLITSHGSEQIAVQVFRLGVRDYLIKPFTAEELLEAVEHALSEARLRRERDSLYANVLVVQRQLEVRVRDLHVLQEVSRSVTTMITHSDMLRRIVQAALDITGAEEGAIFTMDETPSQIHLRVGLRRGGEQNLSAASAKAQRAATQSILTRKPAATASSIFVPLIIGEQVLGSLGVSNSFTARFLTDHEREMLQSLGDYTAIIMQSSRLFQELRLSKEREKRHLRNLFEQYVSPQMVERLLKSPQAAALGGVRQPTAILFADIRGFTAFAEWTDPQTLMDVLNRYIAAAATSVLDQDGTLDKFMGDAVMAFFNAPLPQPDYTLHAIRAALRIRESVAQIHQELPAPQRLNFGIGIASGDAVIGNVGTAQRMNYTALGDCVNVARRLQETALGGQILLNAPLYRQMHDQIQAKPLGLVHLKGRATPEAVYELVGMN